MLWVLVFIIAVPLLYVGGNILVGWITQLRPEPIEQVNTTAAATPEAKVLSTDTTLQFLSWNIGYGGLGAETDFFYDDGKMVITPEDWVKRYVAGIEQTLKDNSSADFMFIQEADQYSKRSWHINEVKGIEAQLPAHYSTFAVNYDVKYLPFPWTEPLGRILGGVLTLSKFEPVKSERIALPGITDFPRKLFYLKRCLLMQRYKVSNGKELVAINTHFEAYDDGGVKKQQMALTKKLVEAEYAKGNYVIIGGDWNIAPPDFDVHKWEKEKLDDPLYFLKNDSNYIPGWKYAYDGNIPTNRKNSKAFDEATTFTTVIDYFFVSPNVEVVEVKGMDAKFRYSDHNPVKMMVRLK